ncbi:MAG TPA: polysaccharide biosynthesis/export family protein [Gemmatimonadales bacterium]|nr:polysaccharide biosynthesis/export family protein [Gemmatimonadales bacterium]
MPRFSKFLTLGTLLALVGPLGAQVNDPDSLFIRLSSSQRAMVTRAELQQSLKELEVVLASDGYSPVIKEQKAREAATIRRRLAEGDIRPGDVITLAVAGSEGLSGQFTVTTDRTIVPADAGPISVAGLLRSEVEDYLRKEMQKYIRDPLVRAEANIRIAMFGGINRQGYFIVPASALLTDVIMSPQAGAGPSGNQKIEDSQILRGDVVILDQEGFKLAIREAKSLDQLNLQAGDEIRIGQKRSGRTPILAYIGAASSLTFIILRIF